MDQEMSLVQISPRDLQDEVGGAAILEMAFNKAQRPCGGIQYMLGQRKLLFMEVFGRLLHFLINCVLIKIKGKGEGG